MRASQINAADPVTVTFSSEDPVELPALLDRLVQAQQARAQRTPANGEDWLFPGRQPGRRLTG